jgi:hypothetical protein
MKKIIIVLISVSLFQSCIIIPLPHATYYPIASSVYDEDGKTYKIEWAASSDNPYSGVRTRGCAQARLYVLTTMGAKEKWEPISDLTCEEATALQNEKGWKNIKN